MKHTPLSLPRFHWAFDCVCVISVCLFGVMKIVLPFWIVSAFKEALCISEQIPESNKRAKQPTVCVDPTETLHLLAESHTRACPMPKGWPWGLHEELPCPSRLWPVEGISGRSVGEERGRSGIFYISGFISSPSPLILYFSTFPEGKSRKESALIVRPLLGDGYIPTLQAGSGQTALSPHLLPHGSGSCTQRAEAKSREKPTASRKAGSKRIKSNKVKEWSDKVFHLPDWRPVMGYRWTALNKSRGYGVLESQPTLSSPSTWPLPSHSMSEGREQENLLNRNACGCSYLWKEQRVWKSVHEDGLWLWILTEGDEEARLVEAFIEWSSS